METAIPEITPTTHVAPVQPAARWSARPFEADLLGQWGRLWSHAGASPFAAPWWHACWAEAFGEAGATRLHCLLDGHRLLGIVPLVRRPGWIRACTTPHNAHTPLVDCVCSSDLKGAADRLLSHLSNEADVLEWHMLPAGDRLDAALTEAIGSRGLRVVRQEEPGRAVLPVAPTWELTRAGLPKALVQTTERKQRQLQRMGRIEFEVLEEARRLSGVLDECFELEAASWKGANGSAIASRPDTLRFYTRLAEEALKAGCLGLYTLRLDGKLAAFEYCLLDAHLVYLLKLSFDAQLGRQSPGNVLRWEILRRLTGAGRIQAYDFGIVSEWKMRWTETVWPLVTLRVYFGHARGRLAHALGPGVREGLKRVPGLHGAVRAVRSIQAHQRRARHAALRKETAVAADRASSEECGEA